MASASRRPGTSRARRRVPEVGSALLDDVLTDYRINGRRSLDTITDYIEGHVRPFFGTRKAASVTTADVPQYVAERQAEGAADATITRELATITRAYTLGLEAGTVTHKPAIKSLKEDNARKGFFEREQYEAVRAKMPAPLKPVVGFLYLTGWRVDSEVLPLQWRQVDFEGGTVRLDPGTTKNGEARVFRSPLSCAGCLKRSALTPMPSSAKGHHLPARVPPRRGSDQHVPALMEIGLQGGGLPRSDSPRLPPHCRP